MLTACLTAETTNTGIRIYALDPETFSDPDEPARVIRWLCEQRPADLSGREVLVTDSAIRARVGLAAAG